MAVVNYHQPLGLAVQPQSQNPNFNSRKIYRTQLNTLNSRRRGVVNCLNGDSDSNPNSPQDEEVNSLGVKAALSMLKFYKREISPLMPKSCRYVPTCSEYSMEAYKRYGVAKGTVLTAWRLCRCNPLGGSGYDPPRWFNEPNMPEE
ncbi:putative membrane protein insertion efficiency factor [Rosa chinensis]|uniref:Putative membrane protein insertion efficiency factor n=1 Tax=Rosa chinensis TaxID=74649 RepID=A0A2P6R9Y9_ROSCH|nr:UPF0161 protein At3g09310 [Rosa chinensis]PRQ43247.1 putative membrane protein insertion efficiency factor [Rosa chinensis]